MLPPRDPKDDVAKRTTDFEMVESALMLTDVDASSLGLSIANWTADERAEAFEWAMREALGASDNDAVVRFARPKHVEALGLYKWE